MKVSEKGVHVDALLHVRRIVAGEAFESKYSSKERKRAILYIIDNALANGLGSQFTAAELKHAAI